MTKRNIKVINIVIKGKKGTAKIKIIPKAQQEKYKKSLRAQYRCNTCGARFHSLYAVRIHHSRRHYHHKGRYGYHRVKTDRYYSRRRRRRQSNQIVAGYYENGRPIYRTKRGRFGRGFGYHVPRQSGRF